MKVETPSGFQQYRPVNLLAHRPDEQACEHASTMALKPVKVSNTLAFMFETRFPQRLTQYASELPELQDNHIDRWKRLKKHFNPNRREPG
jgi:homogentisate 1,2-dioxygenase